MLHCYSKVTIILRKRKMSKETIIVRRIEYIPLYIYDYGECTNT